MRVLLTRHVGYLILYQLQKFMNGTISESADNTPSKITESSASTASIWDEIQSTDFPNPSPVHPTLATTINLAKQIYL